MTIKEGSLSMKIAIAILEYRQQKKSLPVRLTVIEKL
jgi:hypothetical protein